MSDAYIKSETQISKKKSKKFAQVLRRLATFEDLKPNKTKVTITKNKIFEERKNTFTEPSVFKKYSENSTKQNMTEKTSVNAIENSNLEIILSPFIEPVDYPESSDLSGEE